MTLRASACGKIILLGEHAVVYGQPALAVPVSGLRARAELSEGAAGFRLEAPAVGLSAELGELPPDEPLAFCVRLASQRLAFPLPPASLRIDSDIPLASGLGSGAAVATAIVRVFALASGQSLSPGETSQIVYEVERLYHGTPSGVDNTVIAYEKPVFFRRGEEPAPLRVGGELRLLIADSGIRSETRSAVAGVRDRWQKEPARYDAIFNQIGVLTTEGRAALQNGDSAGLGQAMYACQEQLRQMEVSLPALDRLVEVARQAGADGAKLTGAGLGGNVVALVERSKIQAVGSAFRKNGAVAVFETVLS